MLKKRIIPVILLKNGIIVQSREFKRYQPIGSPTASVERFSNWESDELIYLDISSSKNYDLKRNDLNHPKFGSMLEILNIISNKCFMPLTFGGGISTVDEVGLRLKNGADKVTINTKAIDSVEFVTGIAKKYGSQCVVVSIDAKYDDGKYIVYRHGKESTGLEVTEFARRCQEAGAGEILLNSIDRDGTGRGFDLELINRVCYSVKIPVIAIGGAGNWEHFEEVLTNSDASAVAAANIFQHSENSVYNCRKYLFEKGLNVRPPSELSLLNKNL